MLKDYSILTLLLLVDEPRVFCFSCSSVGVPFWLFSELLVSTNSAFMSPLARISVGSELDGLIRSV